MEINWPVLGIIVIGLIILIGFIIKKNQKDKKKLTEMLNNDFKKAKQEDADGNDDD